MKKQKLFILLLSTFFIPSCTFIRVKNPTSGRCVVNFMLEDQTGEYVKDETYSYVDQRKVGELVRVRPVNIDGYTCISSESDLCGTIPDIYYLGINVYYRKNYRSVVQNRKYSSFLPNSEFSCYGDTVYIYRTNEALPKIVVLDKDNCSYTSPDMSKSGTIDMKVTCEEKQYDVTYPYVIASTEDIINNVRDLLKTKKFTVTHNSGVNNDYSFKVTEVDYDFYTNSVVADLYNTFKTNLLSHTEDRDEMESDRRTFAHALVKQYGAFAEEQIKTILTSSLQVLDNGVLRESGDYITLGSQRGYNSQIKKNITIANGDNRFWIPEGYKPNYIYQYASHLGTDFNDPELVRDLYYGLVNDSIKSVANIIIERECYYAVQTTGKLTVDGNTIDEFAFVWKFNSADYPTLKYVGHTTYDPNVCKEYRLQSPLFNIDFVDGYKGGDIATTNDNANYMIRNQVDDMFK